MKLEFEDVDPSAPPPEFHRRIRRWESRERYLPHAWALFLECGHVSTLIEIQPDILEMVRTLGHVLCVQCRDGHA